MKILFAIPTWNRAEQLFLTLQKIIKSAEYAQKKIAILVSDNHSTDGTALILSKIKEIMIVSKLFNPLNIYQAWKTIDSF